VRINTGKYAGHTGTVESNVYQKSTAYPNELANGFHIMLDTGELVTVRRDQVSAQSGLDRFDPVRLFGQTG